MKSISLSLSTAVFATFAMACSSDDQSTDGNTTPDPTDTSTVSNPPPGAPECDPNAEIPCIEGIAEPCGIDTGWEGDEFCLAEPDPGVGIQIHVGPTDYDNPDDYGRFVIQPGDETNWAEVTETPNEELVHTNGYYSFMRPGSHHFILFSVPEGSYTLGRQAATGGAEATVGALDGQFRAGATKPIQGAILEGSPERQLGAPMEPLSDVAINLHFINTSTEPLLQEIWINFKLIAGEAIRRWTKPITWYGGVAMNIPPGAHEVVTNEGDGQRCGAPTMLDGSPVEDPEFVVLTGHVHASTVRYNALVQRAGATEREIVFEDYNWHDPTQFMFLEDSTYPTPDPVSGTAGAQSGIFDIQAGDEFFWECEVINERTVNLTFSNQVYDGEMCNVFGFYSSPDPNIGNWACLGL